MTTDFTALRPPGRNAHVFQPPQSPASPAFATGGPDYFSSQRSRKRQRPGSSHPAHGEEGTPWKPSYDAATPSWVQYPTPSDAIYGSSGAHNSAIVNERYRLAGGFDTPGLMASAEQNGRGEGDVEFRRRVRDIDNGRNHGTGAPIAGPLARERNGVARMLSSPNGSGQVSGGWTGFAFGLVGKVFDFGTSVIKGFYAGGGHGYKLQQQLSPPSLAWIRSQQYAGGGTPLPGSWQNDGEFLGDFEQDNPSAANSPSVYSNPRPPNKRRQTDRDTWVMVGAQDTAEMSPKRKNSSNNVPRISNFAAGPTASRANSRRSLAPVSRRSSSYVTQTGSPALPTPHAVDSGTRRASFAPMRSPNSPSRQSSGGGRPSSAGGASIDPDAERLRKRQARQEKVVDKTMTNMNRQLKDLIQQAQAALGTKYSVEGTVGSEEMMDEGFVDEEW
ncbi:hypothetical protein LTR37_014990 [Vermiconidia calcicola]|uniref:Uncharacterized protein n=1 Tax=Vermiconidia calcicola TaxID=1690605 RepID=A0ACC3MS03_9PEZI|nr:hypothetical protein LTR37_014990 [Vermiconidia calcicola]